MDVSYATSDGYQIAYRVAGDGPVDLVMVPGFVSHLEVAREEPLSRASSTSSARSAV